jgi:ribosome biogenesis protein BMS1
MNRRAVILEPQEKQVVSLLQSLDTIRHEKEALRKSKIASARASHLKKIEDIDSVTKIKTKERRKEFFKQMDFKDKKRKRE